MWRQKQDRQIGMAARLRYHDGKNKPNEHQPSTPITNPCPSLFCSVTCVERYAGSLRSSFCSLLYTSILFNHLHMPN